MNRLFVVTVPTLGFTTYGAQLRKAFAHRDDVEVAHLTLRAPILQKALMRGYRFEPKILDSALRRRLIWRSRLPTLDRGIRAFRPDAVHFAPQFIGPLVMSACRRAGIPFSVAVDATAALTAGPKPWHVTDRLVDTIDRRTFHAAKAVLPWSEWAADSLRRDYGVANVVVLPPPVSVDVPVRDWSVVRAKDPVRIAYIGNDWARKGGERLLKWHAELPDHVELHLAGRDVPAVGRDRVVVHGSVPHDRVVGELLPSMDVLCLPTRHDMSPLVVAEAAAAGVPVVATRLAGIPELVQDRETGILCTYDDDAAWLEALGSLAGSLEYRASLGRRARRFACARLDASATGDRILGELFG